MNKHLKDADSAAARQRAPAGASPSLLGQVATRQRRPWINWLVVFGVLFGAYLYLGHLFLKKEFTWAYLSGQVAGQATAAATAAAASEVAKAEAEKASKVAAKVLPYKVREAEAVAGAVIGPKTRELAFAKDLEVAAAARTEEATAYQKCRSAVRAEVTSALQASADKTSPQTIGNVVPSEFLLEAAMERCERFREHRDNAIEAAEAAASQAMTR